MEYDSDFVKIPPQATAQRKHRPALYFNPEKVRFGVAKQLGFVIFRMLSDCCSLRNIRDLSRSFLWNRACLF